MEHEQFVSNYTNSQLRKLKGVYCFTFPNGKRYVGITYGGSNFAHRFTCHKKDVKKGSIYPVHCAIRSFGWANVKREIILISDDVKRIKSLEQQLIAFWKLNLKRFNKEAKGYNLTDGGDGCVGPSGTIPWNKGKTGLLVHTDEAKQLIGERSKEMWADGTHSKEKHIKKMIQWHKDHPEHSEAIAQNGRDRFKEFNYEFHFKDGHIDRPIYWREYIRSIFCGNENLAVNIRQMVKGIRSRVHDIVRILKYDLDGNLVADSRAARNSYLMERKEYLKFHKKPNKGCRYIIQEPSGEKVEIQHLSNYCKEKGLLITSLMRKYKGANCCIKGYQLIEKLGWN